MHGCSCLPAPVLVNGCIVLLCRVHVLVSQHIRHQVDVSGLLVEGCAVGAAELMGRDLLVRRDLAGIFLHHVLHCLDTHTALLGGEEEGVLVAGQGRSGFAG